MDISLIMGLEKIIEGAMALYVDPGIAGMALVFGLLTSVVLLAWSAGSMIAAALMAKKRGQNIALWVVLAVFIGWIAVLILAIIGDVSGNSGNKNNE